MKQIQFFTILNFSLISIYVHYWSNIHSNISKCGLIWVLLIFYLKN